MQWPVRLIQPNCKSEARLPDTVIPAAATIRLGSIAICFQIKHCAERPCVSGSRDADSRSNVLARKIRCSDQPFLHSKETVKLSVMP